MRGTVAKKIRKKVYGDFSTQERKYQRDDNNCRSNVGLRKDYQEAKKEYYKTR
jgi:hypothetical protein